MRRLLTTALVIGIGCAGPRHSEPSPAVADDVAALSDTTEAFPDTSALHRPLALVRDSLRTALALLRASRASTVCPMPVAVPVPGATVPIPVARMPAISKMPVVPIPCVNPLFRSGVGLRPVPPNRR